MSGYPEGQLSLASGQCHMLESMVSHGCFQQGEGAGPSESSLQHPALCGSKAFVVGGWTSARGGGKGLLKLVKAISPPPSSPALGQRMRGWVAQGIPLSPDWWRGDIAQGETYAALKHPPSRGATGGRWSLFLGTLLCTVTGPRAAAAISASAPRMTSSPKGQNPEQARETEPEPEG